MHLAQKRADGKRRAKEKKRWEQFQLEEAEKKLINDYRNTDFEKEPEKIHMVDDEFGIFASKNQRKRIDRSKNRRSASLEVEARWTDTMEEAERLRNEAAARRKEVERQERAAKKLNEKTLPEKQAERQAQKKAEREAKDKARLKIQRKVVDACTQTPSADVIFHHGPHLIPDDAPPELANPVNATAGPSKHQAVNKSRKKSRKGKPKKNANPQQSDFDVLTEAQIAILSKMRIDDNKPQGMLLLSYFLFWIKCLIY